MLLPANWLNGWLERPFKDSSSSSALSAFTSATSVVLTRARSRLFYLQAAARALVGGVIVFDVEMIASSSCCIMSCVFTFFGCYRFAESFGFYEFLFDSWPDPLDIPALPLPYFSKYTLSGIFFLIEIYLPYFASYFSVQHCFYAFTGVRLHLYFLLTYFFTKAYSKKWID